MDMSQVVEYGQSMTFLGSIGGLALALLGAGLAWPARRAPACCVRIPPSSAR